MGFPGGSEVKASACSAGDLGDVNRFTVSIASVPFISFAQLCLTLCNPMDCGTPSLPVHHQLPEFMQTHIH